MIAALDPLEDSEIHGADLNIILPANNLDEQSKAILLALRTATDCFRVRGREIYSGVAESRVHRSSRLCRSRGYCECRLRSPARTPRKLIEKWP